jgi:predicted nucleotidyltransferase
MKIEKLKEYFKKRKGVLLAYLFGSSARGMESAKDIDIAVLFEEKRVKDSLKAHTEIVSDLTSLLRRSDIDLVVLNSAPPLLKHEVIKNGKVLFEKEPELRWDFEVNSELKFYDFEPVRRLFWESLVKRVKEGKLGC